MSTTMNVSLTGPLKKFVDKQVQEGGYSSTSDYVRQLIRDHQQQVAGERLRELIAEGLASGAPQPVTKRYWSAKRKQLAK